MKHIVKLLIICAIIGLIIGLSSALPTSYNPWTGKLDYIGLRDSNCSSGEYVSGIMDNGTFRCSIPSTFTMPPNTVQVDPDEDEVVGERYQTIANALIYVATQTPAVNNLWGIKVSGNNSESFTVPSYVRIIGDGSTRLTGEINGGTLHTDFYEYIIYDATLTNILNTGFLTITRGVVQGGTNNGILIINDGSLDGSVTGVGQLYTFGGYVFSGDISTQSVYIGSYVQIQSGTFPVNSANNCKIFFAEVSGGTWNGVWARTSRFTSTPTFNTGIYRIYGSELIDLNVDNAGDTYNIYGGYGGSSGKTITQTAGTLTTEGLANVDVVYVAGTWNNKGDLYDNRVSGLTATDTQSVIDQIVALIVFIIDNYYTKTDVDTNITSANTSMKTYVDGTFLQNGTYINASVLEVGGIPIISWDEVNGSSSLLEDDGTYLQPIDTASQSINVSNINVENNITINEKVRIYQDDGCLVYVGYT